MLVLLLRGHSPCTALRDSVVRVGVCAAARERILGFYSTGPRIRPADFALEQMFKEYCPHPVLVIVDVRPECEEIPTQAYVTVETVLEVRLPRVVPYALASRLGVWLAGMADGLYRRAHRQRSHCSSRTHSPLFSTAQ